MVVLTGKNLGERQRELNNKVAEVIVNKKDFNDIKAEEEVTDVDILYKIDIASHYEDINYIVEILKSGDSLYISRALKCSWLYDDKYNQIVNVENLQKNIFPLMSIKMKKKMLSTISMHIPDEDSAARYFDYCKNHGMSNIAFKFLIFSSEDFKLSILENNILFKLYSYIQKPRNLQNFIGNSFLLAKTCIEMHEYMKTDIIHNLRYLYVISNENYLDILENYEAVNLIKPNDLKRLGIRISRNIMIKFRSRVLKNSLLYVNKLHKDILTKYCSESEAKALINSLIPRNVQVFWQIDFCTAYCYILNLIPINERFQYVKQLFDTNYPGEPFEMTFEFYRLKYYNLLSIDQRESWALRHIVEHNEILGNGNDYIWYTFVNIDKALIEIKKYVMVTPDSNKRSNIVNILAVAARDHEDLKKVLDYYYERHINENEHHKNNFIDKVLSVHNVFEFNIECWEALNKLFHSLDIYTVGRYTDKVFVAVAVICHILHNIKMPQALLDFIDLDVNYSYFSLLLQKLSKEKSEIVFEYLLELLVNKIKPFEQDPLNKKLRDKLKKYVNNIFNLLKCFQKDDDKCPDIVKKFMDIHSPKTKERMTVTAKDVFRYIKTDAELAVKTFRHSELITNDCTRTLNSTLRKLKVYFNNDVAQAYIDFLNRIIHKSTDDYNSHKVINSAIFSLFQLSDEKFKVTLMEKYHPSEPKIDHTVIDRKVLHIQEAICRFVGYSRPPVPLKSVLEYIKGDYVHFCLPMFNMYLANLPLPLVMEFIEVMLNSPISIQKHALRLAFSCYITENLKALLLSTWKKIKNVSMRRMIYKSLFDKLTGDISSFEGDKNVEVLYEALKLFTSDLHEDDHEDLFELISNRPHRLPDKFIDDYLETAWYMVVKLPRKPLNIDRQIKIIRSIEENINFVQRDFVRKNIIDRHVQEALVSDHHEALGAERLRPNELHRLENLWSAKWNLSASYIIQYRDNEGLEQSLALVSLIVKKCLEMWNDRYKESYIFQIFCFDFIKRLENKADSIWYNNPKQSCGVPIFKRILDILLEALPLKEIYFIVWNLKLIISIGDSLNVTNTVLYDVGGELKPLSYEEILSDKIASHIGHFVQELLVKNQFYSVYLNKISWVLKQKLQNLRGTKTLETIICRSLANIGLKETHLLALTILPRDVTEEMKEIHTEILTKVQEFEDEEIESFLYFKFLSAYYQTTTDF